MYVLHRVGHVPRFYWQVMHVLRGLENDTDVQRHWRQCEMMLKHVMQCNTPFSHFVIQRSSLEIDKKFDAYLSSACK